MVLSAIAPKVTVPELTAYPPIEPVAEGVGRPFWSVMIPTYNRAEYLAQTLRSVLEQAPGPDEMQIEVVDNCSTSGDIEAVVREVGGGRVGFYRQEQNVGMSGNWTTCVRRARGHWVHILHDDDMVMPGFYARLEEAFRREPALGAAFCRPIIIDEEGDWQSFLFLERRTAGVLEDWVERIGVSNRIMFPSMVVKRSAYEKLGGFHPQLIHTPDWDMWKRIAVHYPVWYEPQALALYREHFASDTSRLRRSGANVADSLKSIRIAESYLPASMAAELSRQAREQHALTALEIARRMLARGDLQGAAAQVREGVKCSCSPMVAMLIVHLFLWAGARWAGSLILRQRPSAVKKA
jgi:GT2 family glycosyltransferase